MAGANNKSLKRAGFKAVAIERIRRENNGALTLRSAISAAGPNDIQRRKVLTRLPTRSGVYRLTMSTLDKMLYSNFIPGRMESIRKGLDEGKRMPPVRLVVDAMGLPHVSDGNHRIRVYRERGQGYVDARVEVWRGARTWATKQEAAERAAKKSTKKQ